MRYLYFGAQIRSTKQESSEMSGKSISVKELWGDDALRVVVLQQA